MMLVGIFVTSTVVAEPAAAHRNVAGGALGVVVPFSGYSLWLGDPVNTHVDRDVALSLGGFYYRKLTPSFWAGGLIETETVSGHYGSEKASGQRVALGLSWVGHYPEGPISMELGGFANLAMLQPTYTSDGVSADAGTMFGMEYGAIVGPALTFERFHVALHFEPMFSWFQGGDLEDMTVTDPRFRLKVGYAF
jgi:hypothetical protein